MCSTPKILFDKKGGLLRLHAPDTRKKLDKTIFAMARSNTHKGVFRKHPIIGVQLTPFNNGATRIADNKGTPESRLAIDGGSHWKILLKILIL